MQLIYSVKDSGELVAPPSSADTAEYNLVYRAAEDRCKMCTKISIDVYSKYLLIYFSLHSCLVMASLNHLFCRVFPAIQMLYDPRPGARPSV